MVDTGNPTEFANAIKNPLPEVCRMQKSIAITLSAQAHQQMSDATNVSMIEAVTSMMEHMDEHGN